MFDKDNLNNLKELSTYEVEFKKVYSYKQSLFQSVSKRIDLNDSIYSDFLNKNELIKKHLTFVTLSEVHGNNWVEWDKDYLNYSEDTFQKVIEKFKDEFKENALLETGLFYIDDKKNKLVERFRNRIIFPINNLSGQPIALGGRIIEKKDYLAKYINSPETNFFKKDQTYII